MTSFDELLPHLLELRKRIIICFSIFVLMLLVLLQFANRIYTLIATPLIKLLPPESSLIATQVTSPLLTPLKLTIYVSLFILIPLLIQQIWAFIVPALYPSEKKIIRPLVIWSVLLFYLGVLFSYYLVLPLVFGFLINIVPDGVQIMTDISSYLDFILTLFIAFGLAFQCPIITFILTYFKVLTPERVKTYRPYLIIVAFTVGMFLTPPDVISQTLLAVPMWLLFEGGFLIAKLTLQKQERHCA